MTERQRVAPFRYMEWAKRQQAAAGINLGASGVGPPDPALLPRGAGDLDLAQRGYDMPPEARQRLAERFGVGVDRLIHRVLHAAARFPISPHSAVVVVI